MNTYRCRISLRRSLFEKQGKQTFICWHALFDSREEFIEVVKKHKADVGLKQNVEKMVVYLEHFQNNSI